MMATTFNDILEFPHIPRPVVQHEEIQGIFGHPFQQFALFRCKILEKSIDQQGDILFPLPQGGHEEGNDVETVIEILTETALLHLTLQVLVRRRHYPDIYVDHLVSADALEFLLLKDAEYLRLGLEAHVGHLVKEDRPFMGQVEFATLLLGGPVKAPVRDRTVHFR
jgi:hypothetical protein